MAAAAILKLVKSPSRPLIIYSRSFMPNPTVHCINLFRKIYSILQKMLWIWLSWLFFTNFCFPNRNIVPAPVTVDAWFLHCTLYSRFSRISVSLSGQWRRCATWRQCGRWLLSPFIATSLFVSHIVSSSSPASVLLACRQVFLFTTATQWVRSFSKSDKSRSIYRAI